MRLSLNFYTKSSGSWSTLVNVHISGFLLNTNWKTWKKQFKKKHSGKRPISTSHGFRAWKIAQVRSLFLLLAVVENLNQKNWVAHWIKFFFCMFKWLTLYNSAAVFLKNHFTKKNKARKDLIQLVYFSQDRYKSGLKQKFFSFFCQL